MAIRAEHDTESYLGFQSSSAHVAAHTVVNIEVLDALVMVELEADRIVLGTMATTAFGLERIEPFKSDALTLAIPTDLIPLGLGLYCGALFLWVLVRH